MREAEAPVAGARSSSGTPPIRTSEASRGQLSHARMMVDCWFPTGPTHGQQLIGTYTRSDSLCGNRR
jgi:hypothetical protein